MAQSIILKRSAQEGKTPDTGSLNLGELAINTYDGKVFLKKSGSAESIQTLVTTDSVTTGSVSLTGDLTVLGEINARQFNISVISSSVLYQSGSTNFGNSLDDNHSFTGSVNITGSFLLNGTEVGGTNLPNTYDFNLEQTATYDFEIETEVEGVVSFVTGQDGNVKIKSNPQTADITINDVTYLSVSTASVIVAKSLLPDVSGTIDLGSTDKPFRHLYVGTGSIYLVNPQGTVTKAISANTIVTTTDIASGSINLSATLPSGLVSSSTQLQSAYDSRYALSGSSAPTTWDDITSKPTGLVSSSTQLPTGIISGSSQLPTGIVSGSSQIDVLSTTNIARLATTGSNTFGGAQSVNGNLTINGSALPMVVASTNATDLYCEYRYNTTSVLGYIGNGTGIVLSGGSATDFGIRAQSNLIFTAGGGTERMRISSSGITSIYGTNAAERFRLQNSDSAAYMGFTEQEIRMWRPDGSGSYLTLATQIISGAFGAGAGFIQFSPANTERMRVSANGNIGAPNGSNIYNASDARLKKNVSAIAYGINTISLLNPVKFNWLDGFEPTEDGKDMLGFVAQEVQNVIPEAVESFGGNSLTVGDTTIDNPLRVNEKFIIPVLVKAIQEQQQLIENLQNRLEALENR